jgi:hypothetical protein
MRRLRERAVVGLCALAAVSGVGLVGPASSQAVTQTNRNILIALAGSGSYLAYADFTVKPGARNPSGSRGSVHAELHALNAAGRDVDLGPLPNDNRHTVTLYPYRYSLVGSILTAHHNANSNRVLWWDLAEGTSGVGTLPPNASWEGSAPSGWSLLYGSDEFNRTFAVQSISGLVTDYGQPQPGFGVRVAVSGPKGAVTFEYRPQDKFQHLSYLPWANPFKPVTLARHSGFDGFDPGRDGGCVMSKSLVACTLASHTGDHVVKIPLIGSKWTVYGKFFAVAAVGKRVVIARTNKSFLHPFFPTFISPSGTIRSSSTRLNAHLLVTAFGDLVGETRLRHTLVSLASATSGPRTLVSVPNAAANAKTVIVGSNR